MQPPSRNPILLQTRPPSKTISHQHPPSRFKEMSEKLLKQQVPIIEIPSQQVEIQFQKRKSPSYQSQSTSHLNPKRFSLKRSSKQQHQPFNFSKHKHSPPKTYEFQPRTPTSRPSLNFSKPLRSSSNRPSLGSNRPTDYEVKVAFHTSQVGSPRNNCYLRKRTLFGESENSSAKFMEDILQMSRSNNSKGSVETMVETVVGDELSTEVRIQIDTLKKLLKM